MKALFNHELYVIRETGERTIELEHCETDRLVVVLLSDDRLIIDPTDGDLDEAEALSRPGHCCTCPHETYLTTSVSRHEHRCSGCGETFTDRHRTKMYFGRAPK